MFISRAMQVFITLYQERNMKSAAYKLCLTVPPVRRMLKLTEEWVGEILFIHHNGRLIPTLKSEELYKKISPIYQQIKEINTTIDYKKKYSISSPIISSHILTSIFERRETKTFPPDTLSIRYAHEINVDDDIYISPNPVTCSSFFEEYYITPILELQCIPEIKNSWQKKNILCDWQLALQVCFQNSMNHLRLNGHKGIYNRIDNFNVLQNMINNGKGIFWGLPHNNYSLIGFQLPQKLYLYINCKKKSLFHEKFIYYMSELCPLHREDRL